MTGLATADAVLHVTHDDDFVTRECRESAIAHKRGGRSVPRGTFTICCRTSANWMRWKVRHSTHAAMPASSTLDGDAEAGLQAAASAFGHR
jgi:hypothetical protein